MSNILFHTRFNPAPRKTLGKVYDSHDNVDRLSYVDSTLMINRLINEGRSLNEYRANALRSGQYSGDFKEIVNDAGIPCPVFQSDPVIAMPIIEEAQAQLKSSVANVADKRSVESSSSNTDLDKTDNSQVAGIATGVASAVDLKVE